MTLLTLTAGNRASGTIQYTTISTQMTIYRNFSQEELDAQYNVRAGIPNYLDIFSRWAITSAVTRSKNVCVEDLAYGPNEKQTLDFFPAKDSGRPILAFIHGGYWQSLDKSDFSYLVQPYLDKNINVAVLNYRLAPTVTMRDIVNDNQKAIVWLYANASSLGFDKERIFLSGHSAGGHLTATLAATDWHSFGAPADLLKGGCAISGLYDLEPIRLCYLNKIVGLNDGDVKSFSPSRLPLGRTPLILTVGGAESPEYFRLQKEYEELLRENGTLHSIVDLKVGHHFDAVDELGRPNGKLSEAVISMISAA